MGSGLYRSLDAVSLGSLDRLATALRMARRPLRFWLASVSEALWNEKTPSMYLHDCWQYITLLFSPSDADAIINDLTNASLTLRRANDILRAAELEPCEREDAAVLASIERLGEQGAIPPVYLVVAKRKLIIADGYHRVSAVYWSNDFVDVDCYIAYA